MYLCTMCEIETIHRKTVPERGAGICEVCGTENKLPWLPLFVITGGGGCGKTTVAHGLLRKKNPYFVFEPVYLWSNRNVYRSNEAYWNHMVLLSCQFTKNQMPVAMCGWVNLCQVEEASCAPFFSGIHFLVLACDEATQTERYKARYPVYRSTPPSQEEIDTALLATRLITEEAESRSNATVLDTTPMTRGQVVSTADRWILERLNS